MFIPPPSLVIGAGSGLLAGAAVFHDNQDGPFDQRAGRAGAAMLITTPIAALATEAGIQAFEADIPGQMAAKGIRRATSYIHDLSTEINLSGELVRSGKRTLTEAMLRTVGTRKLMMGGLGAGLGAAIGARYDKPGTGAVIGGGLGLAGVAAAKVGLSKFPLKGGLLTGLAVAGAFAGARMLQEPEYSASDAAVTDETGGYEYGPMDSGVGRRLSLLNAEGKLTLGLHNRRHG
jgi:hypothetical protein